MIPYPDASPCPARALARAALASLRSASRPVDADTQEASLAAAWAWIHREGSRPVDSVYMGWQTARALAACGERGSAAALVERLPLPPAQRRALGMLAQADLDPAWSWRMVRAGVLAQPAWPDARREVWWQVDPAKIGWGGGARLPLFERPVWRAVLDRLAPCWDRVHGSGGVLWCDRTDPEGRRHAGEILGHLAATRGWLHRPVVRSESAPLRRARRPKRMRSGNAFP